MDPLLTSSPARLNADQVTRQSRSNLALAFVSLGREKRADISVFYAFCRLVDDLADSIELSPDEKRSGLTLWRRALTTSAEGESPLAPAVRALIAKYPLTPAMFEEIIDGVEMDLTIASYATWEELRVYCYRVASAVGLASIEIFGYQDPQAKAYAIDLGLALQMTNIIRDVGKDLSFGRVYLPSDDLKQFGYSDEELRARIYDDRFVRLMSFETARARGFFASAAKLLPSGDRRTLIAAEIMAAVYRSLLDKIEADRFRVFQKEYRLSTAAKVSRVAFTFFKLH